MGLFSNKHSERAVEMVANRFEADGAGFIYYHGAGHDGIPVTAEEREMLVARYRRDLQRMMWGGVAVAMAAMIGLTVWQGENLESNSLFFWIFVGLMSLTFGLGSRYIGREPLRYLERRAPTKPAKSKRDVQRDFLMKSSWGIVVGMPLLFMVAIGGQALEAKSPWEAGGWGGLAVLILGLTARNAWLKWRVASTDRS